MNIILDIYFCLKKNRMKNSCIIIIVSVKKFITMIISRTKENGGQFFNPFVRNRKVICNLKIETNYPQILTSVSNLKIEQRLLKRTSFFLIVNFKCLLFSPLTIIPRLDTSGKPEGIAETEVQRRNSMFEDLSSLREDRPVTTRLEQRNRQCLINGHYTL